MNEKKNECIPSIKSVKTIYLLLSLIFFCCTTIVFTSCSDDKDELTQPTSEPEEEPEADYTVMLYGCGGGNLDEALIYNLQQIEGYGYTPKVQFTAQVKYSAAWQEADDEWKGTRLYTLTDKGFTDEQVYGQSYRLDNPDHIADFIRKTKERLPAKKYILVLWNHGSEFGLWDQPLGWSDYEETDTRGLVIDDNCSENGITSAISIFELEEGMKRSGVKLDMMYWDVCMMNMIENLYQIKDYTNYVLGAAHLTPGIGGNYAALIHALENHSDIPSAMKEYIPAMMIHWGELGICDLALTDMSKIDAVVEKFKPISERLYKSRQELEPSSQIALMYDYCQKYIYYFYEEASSTDLINAPRLLANNMLDGILSAKVTALILAVNEMIVEHGSINLPQGLQDISIGISWLTRTQYEYEYEGINGYSTIYPLLRFNQVTSWSNYFKTNDMKNVEYDEENNIFYEISAEE